MKRVQFAELLDWRDKMRAVGFDYHGFPNDYWTEDAAYELTVDQVEQVAHATDLLWIMCLELVAAAVKSRDLTRFGIPAAVWPAIFQSWERQDPSLYGRFDFCYDGVNPPKLYEFNADTPVSLIESAVAQWNWMCGHLDPEKHSQFCLIHEELIQRWKSVMGDDNSPIHFLYHGDSNEDMCTARYMADTAIQAGYGAIMCDIRKVGHSMDTGFVDQNDVPIKTAYKIYPWHWLMKESFGEHIAFAPTTWMEPPWKIILNSKAMLARLWEMFPGHPNLLCASTDANYFKGRPHARKPTFSWGGDSIVLLDANWGIIERSEGANATAETVFQAYYPLPLIDGHRPMVGSWLIGNVAAGIGIRENTDKLITSNLSRFVSHYYRL